MKQAKPKIRLYVTQPLAGGHALRLTSGQSHYLWNVMRCREGDAIAVFNGSDGEWLAFVDTIEKKSVMLICKEQIAEQRTSPDVWLAFAPIKNKTELVVEKAVELGVSALLPVFTRHAVVRSVNREKLTAHAIEAAEQSGRHDVPRIEEHKDVSALLGSWPGDRTLLYGDESGKGAALKTLLPSLRAGKFAILIGPEGGFAAEEFALLRATPYTRGFGMGPRILRADTAAVAALACLQAWCGDWEKPPAFGTP
jgi:16S rRNA (uracil1498-N3)-methyltransferase